jgi:hypothetical protein
MHYNVKVCFNSLLYYVDLVITVPCEPSCFSLFLIVVRAKRSVSFENSSLYCKLLQLLFNRYPRGTRYLPVLVHRRLNNVDC